MNKQQVINEGKELEKEREQLLVKKFKYRNITIDENFRLQAITKRIEELRKLWHQNANEWVFNEQA